MRTAIITILLALAGICFAINNQLTNGGHGIYAEYYLIAGTFFSLVAVILAPIFAINWSKSAAADNSPQISALPKNPTLRKAVIRLQSIYDHLSTADLSETYFNDYHATLDTVQAEIHEDLSPFRIPQSELRRHVSNIGWEGANSGWQISQTKELFCPPEVFRIALSGALNFIKTYEPSESPKEVEAKTDPPKQLQKGATSQPHEQDAFIPDNPLINMLRLVANAGSRFSLDEIADAFGRKPYEIQERFDALVKYDCLSPDESGFYDLTERGKKHLYEQDYEVPYPSAKDPLDETAIKVLTKINEGIGEDYQLARTLKLEHKQVGRALRLLEWRKLIRRDQSSDVIKRYLITGTGRVYVNEFGYKVHQPPTQEPDDYEPDETAKKILHHIKIGNKYDSILAVGLGFKEELIRLYLLLLERYGYIVWHQPANAAPYSELTKKGDDTLTNYKVPPYPPPAPADYKPDKTAIETLKEIAKGNGYESQIAEALKLNPVQVGISLSLLNQHDYIELQELENRGSYYRLKPKGSDFLKKPNRIVPFPTGHDIIDDAKLAILAVIASLVSNRYPSAIARETQMHIERVKYHLDALRAADYVFFNSIHRVTGEPDYQLTDKAREFLIGKNLI
ncbi:MAG: hypothetical protein ACJ741_00730 [Pyrinomonadaceae bacterium]